MKQRGLVGILLVLAFTIGAWGSGTLIYEQGSKASAQAGAVVARADTPTAVFYNPAGLAFQDGMQFTVNMTYIHPDVKYESPTLGNYKNQAENFFLPAIYFSMPLTPKITFGIGSMAPFNLATDWADDFPGRFSSRHAKIVTYDIRPVLSFRLDDNNAIAFGVDYYDSSIDLIRALNTSALSTAVNTQYPSPPFPPGIPIYAYSEGTIDTHLRDQAIGWNVSYMYKQNPFSFGLFYHSSADFDYHGYSSFEISKKVGPLAAYMPGQEVSLGLESVPAEARMGFAYTGDPLEVEFDINWTQWSTWGRSMAHFTKPTPAVQDEMFIFDWEDGYSFRLGFNYKYNDNYNFYWGILYDQAPVPDSTRTPVLPDEDRWSAQFGTGWHRGGMSIDWYAMYIQFKDASATNAMTASAETGLPKVVVPGVGQLYPTSYDILPDGEYKGTAYLFGIQFSYKF